MACLLLVGSSARPHTCSNSSKLHPNMKILIGSSVVDLILGIALLLIGTLSTYGIIGLSQGPVYMIAGTFEIAVPLGVSLILLVTFLQERKLDRALARTAQSSH